MHTRLLQSPMQHRQSAHVSARHPCATNNRPLQLCTSARNNSAAAARTIGGHDLILSSGFLAFANHSGFLQAVEEAGLPVLGVMGTSAGALAGSLYCAGYTPQQVAQHLSRDAPITLLRPSVSPWRGGVLSLEAVVDRLRELLPPRFEDLQKEFAVGVVTANGQYRLIDSGPLPEAVVASAAIPFMFEGVSIPGQGACNPFQDGGVVDRVGLSAWRDRRRAQAHTQGRPDDVPPALVHVISRSSPFSGFDDVTAVGERRVTVVHSPRSGVNFMSLGDFEAQMRSSIRRARPLLVEATAAAAARAPSRTPPSQAAPSSSSSSRSPELKRLARSRAT